MSHSRVSNPLPTPEFSHAKKKWSKLLPLSRPFPVEPIKLYYKHGLILHSFWTNIASTGNFECVFASLLRGHLFFGGSLKRCDGVGAVCSLGLQPGIAGSVRCSDELQSAFWLRLRPDASLTSPRQAHYQHQHLKASWTINYCQVGNCSRLSLVAAWQSVKLE